MVTICGSYWKYNYNERKSYIVYSYHAWLQKMSAEDKLRILVVDDEQRMAITAAAILRAKGYYAETAFSGSEAVEKVKADSFDTVLMDIKMQGMNGVEAFAKIKSFAPAMPVVLMTAYSDDELFSQARKQGVRDILTKPLDFDALLSVFGSLEKRA